MITSHMVIIVVLAIFHISCPVGTVVRSLARDQTALRRMER